MELFQRKLIRYFCLFLSEFLLFPHNIVHKWSDLKHCKVKWPAENLNNYFSATGCPIDLKPGCKLEFVRCLEV